MTADFWRGLAVIPGFLVFAAVSIGLALGLLWLWGRFTPTHWHLSGPMRRSRSAAEVFRRVDVAGGHAKTLRRLMRLGPYGFYVVRYAPGDSDAQPEPERIP